MTTEEPFGPRYSPDKLAVLSAERPLVFVAVRSLAVFTLLLALVFVLDGLARLAAWIASSPIATFFFLDETMSEQDRNDVMSIASGFPHDLARLALMLASLSLLVVVELLGTRGLPTGMPHMEAAIVNGLPWRGQSRVFEPCDRLRSSDLPKSLLMPLPGI